MQWYGDLLGLAFFLLLLVGAVNLASGGGELFRKLTAFVVATVPVLVALGLLRAVALLRRGTGASWRDAVGAFLVWQSTALVVARASVQGLFAKRAEFLRTPKTTDRTSWWTAIRANWAETGLAVLGLAGIAAGLSRVDTYAGPLLAGLLLFPTLGPRRGAGQQPGRAAGHAAARPRRAATHRVAAGPAGAWRGRRRDRGRDLVGIGIVAALLSTPSSAPVQPPAADRPGPGQGDAGRVARSVRQPRWEPVPLGLGAGRPGELRAERDRRAERVDRRQPDGDRPDPPGPLAPTATVPPTTAPAPATTTP